MKNTLKQPALWLTLASAVALTACGKPAEAPQQQSRSATASTELVDTEFNPKLAEYIKTLSDDKFQGRAPATKGEELTVAYIEDNFRRIGLKGIDGDSYKQPVSLVQIDPTSQRDEPHWWWRAAANITGLS